MSSLLVTELRRQGIRVEMDTEVTSFQPEGKGFSAILSNGRELPADTAVLSIGVKPNSELAKTAGLELGTRGPYRHGSGAPHQRSRHLCRRRCD